MLDKKKLTKFLLKARANTYAGNTGETRPLFQGAKQFEYRDKDWLYRDVYNQGNGKFAGLETVYLQNKPVLSMSYYGNFSKMTEEEADKILRQALVDKWNKARLWHTVNHKIGDYVYINEGSGNIDEFEGSEQITKDGKILFFFYYASGLIG